MDDTLDTINAAAALFSATVLGYIVLDQRIREGGWIKSGLCVTIVALLASAALTLQASASGQAWANVGLALRVGIALVCVGVLVRAHRLGRVRRAAQGLRHRAQRHRGLIYHITEPARDVADMLRSDWAALDGADAEERHRERQP